MTQYTVVWAQEALDNLTWMWLASSNRAAINSAASTIDKCLANKPLGVGNHLAEGLRRFAVAPLMSFYVVREDDRIVEVVRVRLARHDELQ